MLAKSHMALGLLGGFGATYLMKDQPCDNTIFLSLVVFGSILPDIDEPRSFIGRKFPLVSHIVGFSFTHRGFTHFFLFPILFFLSGFILFPYHNVIAIYCFAIGFGVFIHQIGDMLTVSGIPYYFFPISSIKAVLLPKMFRFKTGGIIEKIIFIFILLPLVVLLGVKYLYLLNNFNIHEAINSIGGLS